MASDLPIPSGGTSRPGGLATGSEVTDIVNLLGYMGGVTDVQLQPLLERAGIAAGEREAVISGFRRVVDAGNGHLEFLVRLQSQWPAAFRVLARTFVNAATTEPTVLYGQGWFTALPDEAPGVLFFGDKKYYFFRNEGQISGLHFMTLAPDGRPVMGAMARIGGDSQQAAIFNSFIDHVEYALSRHGRRVIPAGASNAGQVIEGMRLTGLPVLRVACCVVGGHYVDMSFPIAPLQPGLMQPDGYSYDIQGSQIIIRNERSNPVRSSALSVRTEADLLPVTVDDDLARLRAVDATHPSGVILQGAEVDYSFTYLGPKGETSSLYVLVSRGERGALRLQILDGKQSGVMDYLFKLALHGDFGKIIRSAELAMGIGSQEFYGLEKLLYSGWVDNKMHGLQALGGKLRFRLEGGDLYVDHRRGTRIETHRFGLLEAPLSDAQVPGRGQYDEIWFERLGDEAPGVFFHDDKKFFFLETPDAKSILLYTLDRTGELISGYITEVDGPAARNAVSLARVGERQRGDVLPDFMRVAGPQRALDELVDAGNTTRELIRRIRATQISGNSRYLESGQSGRYQRFMRTPTAATNVVLPLEGLPETGIVFRRFTPQGSRLSHFEIKPEGQKVRIIAKGREDKVLGIPRVVAPKVVAQSVRAERPARAPKATKTPPQPPPRPPAPRTETPPPPPPPPKTVVRDVVSSPDFSARVGEPIEIHAGPIALRLRAVRADDATLHNFLRRREKGEVVTLSWGGGPEINYSVNNNGREVWLEAPSGSVVLTRDGSNLTVRVANGSKLADWYDAQNAGSTAFEPSVSGSKPKTPVVDVSGHLPQVSDSAQLIQDLVANRYAWEFVLPGFTDEFKSAIAFAREYWDEIGAEGQNAAEATGVLGTLADHNPDAQINPDHPYTYRQLLYLLTPQANGSSRPWRENLERLATGIVGYDQLTAELTSHLPKPKEDAPKKKKKFTGINPVFINLKDVQVASASSESGVRFHAASAGRRVMVVHRTGPRSLAATTRLLKVKG